MSGEFLGRILERKRLEVARRLKHRTALDRACALPIDDERGAYAIERLRRAGSALPKVIAEVKLRSPSAGAIRVRSRGEVLRIARGYVTGGASAVSVLCDGPGFGGSPLDLRRAAAAIDAPLLFKEFVVHPVQIDLARAMGAHMVLLLVRALRADELAELVAYAQAQGLAPVVEAADEDELVVALSTEAAIVGVNARDLRTFKLDGERARRAIEMIPRERVAVLMSGITSARELRALSSSRADAVLIGEGLMRAADPGAQLASWLREG